MNQNWTKGHLTLVDDYFASDALFVENLSTLSGTKRAYDNYFISKKYAIEKFRFSDYHKYTTTLTCSSMAQPHIRGTSTFGYLKADAT